MGRDYRQMQAVSSHVVVLVTSLATGGGSIGRTPAAASWKPIFAFVGWWNQYFSFLPVDLAEGLKGRMLNEIRTPDPKSLELGAAHAALDPLVHRLARDRRVDELPGLFHTVIFAHPTIAGTLFLAGAAHTETS